MTPCVFSPICGTSISPCPITTGLLRESGGLPGLLTAGATALDVPPGSHVSQVRLLPPLQPASVRDFVTF